MENKIVTDKLFETNSEAILLVDKAQEENPGKELSVSFGYRQGTFGKRILIHTDGKKCITSLGTKINDEKFLHKLIEKGK